MSGPWSTWGTSFPPGKARRGSGQGRPCQAGSSDGARSSQIVLRFLLGRRRRRWHAGDDRHRDFTVALVNELEGRGRGFQPRSASIHRPQRSGLRERLQEPLNEWVVATIVSAARASATATAIL